VSLFTAAAKTGADGAAIIFRHACRMCLEGIVSKRLRSGPSRNWLKVKNPNSPAMIRAREAEW
jgi:ATP-dependent DNA ligase